MKFGKGFRQFLGRTGVFLVLFILISFVIGQGIVVSSLLMDFKFFIYGGMGKVMLFSIFGFVLFYRDRLLKMKFFRRENADYSRMGLSFVCTLCFYVLTLNIDKFSPGVLSIFLFHLLFLGIFVFLIMGIYGKDFLKDFLKRFRKELGYFAVFGIVVYFLMFYVWKAWPFFSGIVVGASSFLLGLIGEVRMIGDFAISFDGFAAEIGEACSGIYSIFIFSSLYLFAVIMDWGKLNKKKVCLVFVPAVVGAFLVNVFRVFLLFVVGAYISRDLAIGLYHSYVGMIFFLIYFSVFWFWFYDFARRGVSCRDKG